MPKKIPIFYNALLLTGVNLLLRFIGTAFQVFLSGRIGAEGIGLLQLIMTVGSFALTVGMGGIRTATMYLCAEAVGQKRQSTMAWVLSGCILYSICLSTFISALLYGFAPQIAKYWVGESITFAALRVLAVFLPVNCLCGVMIGYFTGVNKIRTLAAVEVAEQIVSMVCTVLLLIYWAKHSIVRACFSVILGSGFGACFTLIALTIIKKKDFNSNRESAPIGRKLLTTAVPLGVGDTAKAGINAFENLMVPKRLSLYPGETSPLAAFGTICGMVFPLLMFPAAILFGLAELLIPELARCNAAGSTARIRHLTERSLLLTLLYGTICGGIIYISANKLCVTLYNAPDAGKYLQQFALLAPMLYCDVIVDAINKGLGKQKISVRYNIITSTMDVALLFILLPKYGMKGYFVSFLITHLINFLLSIRLLLAEVGQVLPLKTVLLTSTSSILGILIIRPVSSALIGCITYGVFFIAMTILARIIGWEDIRWIKGLISM